MESVALAPMTARMAHEYFKAYESDPDLCAKADDFTPFEYDPEWVKRYIRRQSTPGRRWFAILRGGELAGELILKRIRPGRCATLSISLKAPRYKDHGIGTRAERLAIDLAFGALDLPVLYADALLTNTRSRHVLEKAGFTETARDDTFAYYAIRRPAPSE